MNNRKFKLWFLLLVLGIAGVLIYRLLTVESRIPEHLPGDSSPQTGSIDPLNTTSQIKADNKQTSLPQFTPSEIDSIIELLQPHMFHEDAYVEATLLFELKSSCKYSKTKTKLPCDEITTRYKKLEAFIKNYQDLQHIPTSTELGEVFKQGWGYDAKQPEVYRQKLQKVLKLLIKSNNPLVLSYYSTYFIYGGVLYGEILPFTEWLGSQDQDYNGMVLMHALLKIAHQFEANRAEFVNDYASSLFCSIDNSVCGLGFEEAYDLLVMPGMQKDVDILMKYLQAFTKTISD